MTDKSEIEQQLLQVKGESSANGQVETKNEAKMTNKRSLPAEKLLIFEPNVKRICLAGSSENIIESEFSSRGDKVSKLDDVDITTLEEPKGLSYNDCTITTLDDVDFTSDNVATKTAEKSTGRRTVHVTKVNTLEDVDFCTDNHETEAKPAEKTKEISTFTTLDDVDICSNNISDIEPPNANRKKPTPTTLDDINCEIRNNVSEQPIVRKRRALIDVPNRINIGPDGLEIDEF